MDTYRCAHIGQHPYLLSLRPDGLDQSLTVFARLFRLFQLFGLVSKLVLNLFERRFRILGSLRQLRNNLALFCKR